MPELHAIDRGIFARDVDRYSVDVGGDAFRFRPQRKRCEREQAGAGADVGDVPEPRPLELEFIERCQAPAGRCMLPRAERERGIDFEIDTSRVGQMGWRVDREAAGTDRLKTGLAHRHPILFAELLDLGRSRTEPRQDHDLLADRMMIEISVDHPLVRLCFVRLVGDEHRRIAARWKENVRVRYRFTLGARARDRDTETHGFGAGDGAASCASRSSSCFDTFAE